MNLARPFASAAAVVAIVASLTAGGADDRALLAGRVTQLTRTSAWKLVSSVPIAFPTHHPQGMVKIGGTFFVSSVDRDKGAGHLFKIDGTGHLLADLPMGEGSGSDANGCIATRRPSRTSAR